MDFLMLITAYGKLGDFNGAEMVLRSMNGNGYVPNVVSHTALMEAYGRGGRYNNAEAIFRRMQTSGPEPSALTYQIILKTFVEVAYLSKYTSSLFAFVFLLDLFVSLISNSDFVIHILMNSLKY
jgi:pentatricopeptide repeat protein